jgi:glycosyltransferase involved in cell wall biosynthesis
MAEVSVIIPSYNHADYIASAVQSVLSQTWQDLELIVVDDGSEDDSLRVLGGFADRRMRILTQENQGAHAALNRGLGECGGKYLAMLNSDDCYHPQRLEKCRRVLREKPQVGLVGSHIQIIDRAGKAGGIKHGYADCPPWLLEKPEKSFRAGTDLHAALLTENFWSTTSNYVITREAYQKVGNFRPLRYTHDWDFALRVAEHFPMELIPEALVSYRIHEKNTIRENPAAMIFEICWILAVHLPEYLSRQAEVGERLVEQLLNSIHTYEFDRVLNGLLLQRLDENMARAIRLLDSANAERRQYLEYIEEHISTSAADSNGSLYRRLRRKLRPLKAWFFGKRKK